jgi:hypothetical protein
MQRHILVLLTLLATLPQNALSSDSTPCHNGLCDVFRMSINTMGGSSSLFTPTLPGGSSPHVEAPASLDSSPIACSKTVRVPKPVYEAIVSTMGRMANRDYLARVQEFTPHEQTMLLFFHTVIQQARGLRSCGGN